MKTYATLVLLGASLLSAGAAAQVVRRVNPVSPDHTSRARQGRVRSFTPAPRAPRSLGRVFTRSVTRNLTKRLTRRLVPSRVRSRTSRAVKNVSRVFNWGSRAFSGSGFTLKRPRRRAVLPILQQRPVRMAPQQRFPVRSAPPQRQPARSIPQAPRQPARSIPRAPRQPARPAPQAPRPVRPAPQSPPRTFRPAPRIPSPRRTAPRTYQPPTRVRSPRRTTPRTYSPPRYSPPSTPPRRVQPSPTPRRTSPPRNRTWRSPWRTPRTTRSAPPSRAPRGTSTSPTPRSSRWPRSTVGVTPRPRGLTPVRAGSGSAAPGRLPFPPLPRSSARAGTSSGGNRVSSAPVDPLRKLIRRIPTAPGSTSGPGRAWLSGNRTARTAAGGSRATVRSMTPIRPNPKGARRVRPSGLGTDRYPSASLPPRVRRGPNRGGSGKGGFIRRGNNGGFRSGRINRNYGYSGYPRLTIGRNPGPWRHRVNRDALYAGFGLFGRRHRYYYNFSFGFPVWWWTVGWYGRGFSPWYTSWAWCWNWVPWWRRRYVAVSYFYPGIYGSYVCLSYTPRSVWYGMSWLFALSLPYAYVWFNQADCQDGWYSPYVSRVTVNCDAGAENYVASPVPQQASQVELESKRGPDSTIEVAKRYVKLGDAYFDDGRYMESADSYLRALTYVPNSPSVYFALADSLFAAGDYHYAAYAIRKGVTMDETLVKSKVDKRTFYKDPALFLKQEARLEEWVKAHPRDGDAWLVLGYNRFFSRDLDGARKAFLKVADLVPGDMASAIFLKEIAARAKK